MGSTVGLTFSAAAAFALQGAVMLCAGLPGAYHGVELWNEGVVDVLVQCRLCMRVNFSPERGRVEGDGL